MHLKYLLPPSTEAYSRWITACVALSGIGKRYVFVRYHNYVMSSSQICSQVWNVKQISSLWTKISVLWGSGTLR